MLKLFTGSSVRGFTIVELLVVIVVIGILATLGIVAYNGVTNNARDNAVLSDADGVAGEVARYGTNNNGQYGSAVEWYSGNTPNANINFTPSEGTIIDVAASTDEYCVRAYNPAAKTYTNLYNAATKESDDGVCNDLFPSSAAVAANAGVGGSSVRSMFSSNNASSCAITVAGTAYCWGAGTSGQLGNSVSADSSTAVPVTTTGSLSGKSLKQIAAMANTLCGLSSEENVYCWGLGTSGQLGNGASLSDANPQAVSTSGVLSGKTVEQMSAGNGSICVIASDRNGYCWGTGSYGRLGNNSTANSNVPVAVSTSGVLAGKTLKQIAVGSGVTCAIASDNKAYCWGNGTAGQLGNGAQSDSSVPVAVSTSGVLAGKSLKQIALVSGGLVTCVVDTAGAVYCWGWGGSGMLGNGTTGVSSSPVAVTTSGVLSGKSVQEIFTGEGSHICALATDNQLYCWGYNNNGQLGNNSTTQSSVPVAVTTSGVLSGKTIKQVSLGGAQVCVVASDNLPYCWGLGTSGQLGNSVFSSSSVPVAVTTSGVLSGKTVEQLLVRTDRPCVVASDDAAYCWGWGYSGQLGNGSSSSVSQPTAVLDIGL